MATQTGIELRLTRRFEAPRERVFEAWTDPEVLARWWAAGDKWDTPAAEVDLRVGGRYRLSMRNGETGAVHTVFGEYTDVRPPERLAYTWTWESDDADWVRASERSLVVVEFSAAGGATEVALTHSGFLDERTRDMHADGWTGCLESLERRVFAAGTHAGADAGAAGVALP